MKFNFIILTITLFFFGCNSVKETTKRFHKNFDKGEYNLASEIVKKEISNPNQALSKSDMLWALHLGIAQKAAKQYNESIKTFDKVENLLKTFDYEYLISDAGSQAGAVLSNDNALDYEGTEYDGVMVNTYKALNYLALGDKDNARIELNRANERERRAMKKYSAELANLKNEKKNNEKEVNKAINSSAIQNVYTNMDSWKIYKDFVNPFTVYFSGLFRMLSNENYKAENYFKESVNYSPNNQYIRDDFNRLLKGRTSQNSVWVIFENGLSIIKKEKKIDIPINLTDAPVKYVGIAFPYLEEIKKSFNYLIVDNGEESLKTELISSMDTVIKTEFKKEFPSIITRAVISIVIKTVAQVVMEKEQGELGKLIAAIFAYVTTGADTRIWCSLPKEFQVAKTAIPTNRTIKIDTEYGNSYNVNIPECNNAIIYIKIPTLMAKPVIEVFKF